MVLNLHILENGNRNVSHVYLSEIKTNIFYKIIFKSYQTFTKWTKTTWIYTKKPLQLDDENLFKLKLFDLTAFIQQDKLYPVSGNKRIEK